MEASVSQASILQSRGITSSILPTACIVSATDMCRAEESAQTSGAFLRCGSACLVSSALHTAKLRCCTAALGRALQIYRLHACTQHRWRTAALENAVQMYALIEEVSIKKPITDHQKSFINRQKSFTDHRKHSSITWGSITLLHYPAPRS